jgi:hypothetical protein
MRFAVSNGLCLANHLQGSLGVSIRRNFNQANSSGKGMLDYV